MNRVRILLLLFGVTMFLSGPVDAQNEGFADSEIHLAFKSGDYAALYDLSRPEPSLAVAVQEWLEPRNGTVDWSRGQYYLGETAYVLAFRQQEESKALGWLQEAWTRFGSAGLSNQLPLREEAWRHAKQAWIALRIAEMDEPLDYSTIISDLNAVGVGYFEGNPDASVEEIYSVADLIQAEVLYRQARVRYRRLLTGTESDREYLERFLDADPYSAVRIPAAGTTGQTIRDLEAFTDLIRIRRVETRLLQARIAVVLQAPDIARERLGMAGSMTGYDRPVDLLLQYERRRMAAMLNSMPSSHYSLIDSLPDPSRLLHRSLYALGGEVLTTASWASIDDELRNRFPVLGYWQALAMREQYSRGSGNVPYDEMLSILQVFLDGSHSAQAAPLVESAEILKYEIQMDAILGHYQGDEMRRRLRAHADSISAAPEPVRLDVKARWNDLLWTIGALVDVRYVSSGANLGTLDSVRRMLTSALMKPTGASRNILETVLPAKISEMRDALVIDASTAHYLNAAANYSLLFRTDPTNQRRLLRDGLSELSGVTTPDNGVLNVIDHRREAEYVRLVFESGSLAVSTAPNSEYLELAGRFVERFRTTRDVRTLYRLHSLYQHLIHNGDVVDYRADEWLAAIRQVCAVNDQRESYFYIQANKAVSADKTVQSITVDGHDYSVASLKFQTLSDGSYFEQLADKTVLDEAMSRARRDELARFYPAPPSPYISRHRPTRSWLPSGNQVSLTPPIDEFVSTPRIKLEMRVKGEEASVRFGDEDLFQDDRGLYTLEGGVSEGDVLLLTVSREGYDSYIREHKFDVTPVDTLHRLVILAPALQFGHGIGKTEDAPTVLGPGRNRMAYEHPDLVPAEAFDAKAVSAVRDLQQDPADPGRLIVSNAESGTLDRFVPDESAFYPIITGLDEPEGITADGEGSLYVVESGANRVSVYSPGNQHLYGFGDEDKPGVVKLLFPTRIALAEPEDGDELDGHVYKMPARLFIADWNGIHITDVQGHPFGLLPWPEGLRPGTPHALATEGYGPGMKLHVVDQLTGDVHTYTAKAK